MKLAITKLLWVYYCHSVASLLLLWKIWKSIFFLFFEMEKKKELDDFVSFVKFAFLSTWYASLWKNEHESSLNKPQFIIHNNQYELRMCHSTLKDFFLEKKSYFNFFVWLDDSGISIQIIKNYLCFVFLFPLV